ncbi:hypothetical protein G5B30_16610 [Sphingobacterium sp. SGG-5]|uniref:hypothetical protein n=1 Tax=Sphingobacterium sp. SGG-5 TaxID=2710881 RepID=UPI0013ECD847|nr:hypothetical protein [Sphingobacterium sp. SGG-5]NGM63533.1 hypothetical protein [Sphingobacterium sp. SGG-5]
MLKTKTITTDKATLLVVEVKKKFTLRGFGLYYLDGSGYESLPNDNWQLLGRLPDITEKEYSKIVNPETDFQYEYKYSKEVFNSLLQANEVYFDNPYDNKDEKFKTKRPFCILGIRPCDHIRMSNGEFRVCLCKQWEDFQSKVFDKERTYLFIKVD